MSQPKAKRPLTPEEARKIVEAVRRLLDAIDDTEVYGKRSAAFWEILQETPLASWWRWPEPYESLPESVRRPMKDVAHLVYHGGRINDPATGDPIKRDAVRQKLAALLGAWDAVLSQRIGDGPGDAVTSDGAGGGTTWQDVAGRLERLQASGKEFKGATYYIDLFGCGRTTYYKAIKLTPSLHPWAKPDSTSVPKAHGLTEVVMDNKPQSREANPADLMTDDEAQVTMRRLIKESPPEKRAELHQALSKLPPDELRRILATYADADDLGNRVLGRRP